MRDLGLIFFIFISSIYADVKSTDGTINFDSNSDQNSEATLNSVGLGIGTSPSSNLHVEGNTIISKVLTIGTNSGGSNLNLSGTLGFSAITVSSNTTINNHSVVLADSSSDNITITLPYAGNVTGRQYQIKKISTLNSVWISGGGNLIDDTNPIELPESSDLASVTLISDGNQWYKISQKDLSETIASGNLVGWWKFDETTSVLANDSSSYSNDGTLENTMTFSSNGIHAVIGGGLVFNGTDDYINVGDPADGSLDFGSSQSFSISTWVKMGTDTSTDRLVSKRLGLTGYELVPRNNKTSVFLGDGTDFFHLDIGATDITDNIWHHIVITIDRSIELATVYLDGNHDGSHDFSARNIDSISNSGSFEIGRSGYYKGSMDDLRIYNILLTTSEIQALYDQGQ